MITLNLGGKIPGDQGQDLGDEEGGIGPLRQEMRDKRWEQKRALGLSVRDHLPALKHP